ncbi:MAG: photosystem I assembly protein Ycf3 [Spirochaetes bacterium ADurb.BinA120]|nr:MAG: photosystem I assembly protein Ycf3 [Spirochaetes bacterium ADurb.BinA120]
MIKITLYLSAMALVSFAAARPQGLEKPEEIEASSIDICFAIDVSESMKARDLGRDNRLDITRAVVTHLIDNLKSDRVALVTFAGEASCICPLTLDHASAKSLLMQADFDLIEKGGTRLELAIKTAVERFNKDDEAAKVVVIFTDGEDHDGRPVEAAREAYKNGAIIHCVGIGSKSGVKIPVSQDIWGAPVYKKFNGKDVVTRLNEQVLVDIAAAAGGEYFHVSDQNSLVKMISGLKNIKKRALRVSSFNVREELFAYFAALALIFIIIDSMIPQRSRKNAGIILFLLAAVSVASSAGAARAEIQQAPPPLAAEYDSLTPKISAHSQKGKELYDAGKFGAAESEFQSAKILKPFDIAANYNIGCARYKNRDYKGAIEAYGEALKAGGAKSRFEPFYNMGNSHFKLQDYGKAIESYEQALKIKPDDADTLHNLELAKKKLEQQAQKDQQNKQDQNQGKDGDKNGQGDKKEGDENNSQKGENQKDGNAGEEKKQDGKQENNGGQKEQKAGESGSENAEKKDASSGGEGKDGKEAVKDLVDKQNVEKYKNIQVDPNRLKLFLKDLENDEARVQYLYQQNKKRMNKADEMDPFNMTPEQLRRQMLFGEEPDPGENKKQKSGGDKKDW